jgi:light-regulated signal transduction histidine kinase (bacteriophytochrome)
VPRILIVDDKPEMVRGLQDNLRFVEVHGGRVSVESRVGEGSRFTIALPVAGAS